MRQNICYDYFAFDQTEMIEVVTSQAQYGETQHVEVQSCGLAYTLCNYDNMNKPPKAYPP